MDSYGFSCMFIDFHRFSLIFKDFHGFSRCTSPYHPGQKQAAAAMAGATKLPSEASAVVLEGGCFGLISDQESVIPIVTQEVSLRKRMGGHQTPLVVQNCDVVLVAIIIHCIPHLQSFILL